MPWRLQPAPNSLLAVVPRQGSAEPHRSTATAEPAEGMRSALRRRQGRPPCRRATALRTRPHLEGTWPSAGWQYNAEHWRSSPMDEAVGTGRCKQRREYARDYPADELSKLPGDSWTARCGGNFSRARTASAIKLSQASSITKSGTRATSISG